MAIEEQGATKAAEIGQGLNRVCDTINILPMDGPALMSSSLRRQLPPVPGLPLLRACSPELMLLAKRRYDAVIRLRYHRAHHRGSAGTGA